MSQASQEKSGQSATARAEEMLDGMGRRLGIFAARVGQRVQNTATFVREEAGRTGQQNSAPGGNSHQPGLEASEEKGKLAMERSEELVDRMVQRLSYFAARAGYQVQKANARMREEVEDMWAEAQNIRQENSRKLE